MTNVAVLLSHYNGDNYIKEQVDSILNQSISKDVNISLFVRDDGSTKSDLSILKKYEQAGKLTLYVEKNVGVKLSFYKLMQRVEGFDYYFFSDQDDVWLEKKVQTMVDKLEDMQNKGKAVGVFSDLFITDKYLNTTGQLMKHNEYVDMMTEKNFVKKNILKLYMVTGASFAFNDIARRAALKLGIKTFNATNMHDSTMAFILAFSGEINYLDEALVLYRQHDNNVIGYHGGKSILKKIFSLGNTYEIKINRLFDALIISRKLEETEDQRIMLVKKIFTNNGWKSFYYAWQLRSDMFAPRKTLLIFLFPLFGVPAVKKEIKKLSEEEY